MAEIKGLKKITFYDQSAMQGQRCVVKKPEDNRFVNLSQFDSTVPPITFSSNETEDAL